jgi:ubiquinone/menaquinone biosynthesis C-methylase UbiE
MEKPTIWDLGNYQKTAQQLQFASELLVEKMAPSALWHVLDVGTGTGNSALAMARRGCQVTGVDPAKLLLMKAHERAKAEELEIQFSRHPAEKLPFKNETFDAVVATFTLGFTQNRDQTIKEILRVLKPGGTFGFTQFSYSGYVVELESKMDEFFGNEPKVPPHFEFGDQRTVMEIFAPYAETIEFQHLQILFRFQDATHWVNHYRSYFGPLFTLFQALSGEKKCLLGTLMTTVINQANISKDSSLLLPEDYLQTILIKK